MRIRGMNLIIPKETLTVRIALLSIAAIALIAAPASAHPKVVGSTPAAGASVAAPRVISLTFSEKLFEKMSGATLAKTDGASPVAATAVVSADGKTMTLTPASPLAAGAYKLDWFGVGADTHRVTGAVSFTVR